MTKSIRCSLISGTFALLLVSLVTIGVVATSGRVYANGPVFVQPHTCATQPDAKSCEGQDPYQQQCVADATTVPKESIPAFYQGQHIGVAELRYSARCNSYWDRVIAFPGTPVSAVIVVQTRADATQQGPFSNDIPEADGSIQVYTNMVYNLRTMSDTAMFNIAQGGVAIPIVIP